MESFIIVMIVAILYFLPTAIAAQKKHLNSTAIFAANLIFGWTGIGWCICLIWSLMNSQK